MLPKGDGEDRTGLELNYAHATSQISEMAPNLSAIRNLDFRGS